MFLIERWALDVQRWAFSSCSQPSKLLAVGPRGYDGSGVIVLGSDGTGDREHFDIFLCREFTGNLQRAWSEMKK